MAAEPHPVKNPIEQLLEEDFGAAVVCDEFNDVAWDPIDPDDPYEGLARRMVTNSLTGPVDNRVAALQRLARDYKIDGAINPCQWGCRQGTGARGMIEKGLNEVGVPVLNLEVDCVDALAEKLDSIATSTVIVSPEQRRQQMSAAVDDALPEVFAAPLDEQTAMRLEETAYVLWKREREDDARGCLAAAAAFRAGDAAANETARAMLEATLAPIFQKAEAGPEAAADAPAPEAPV